MMVGDRRLLGGVVVVEFVGCRLTGAGNGVWVLSPTMIDDLTDGDDLTMTICGPGGGHSYRVGWGGYRL